MKNKISLLLLACFSVVLCGCPYESEVPISEPTLPIDTRLIGNWCPDADCKDKMSITADGKLYRMKFKAPFSDGEDELIGYMSMVRGVRFMNVYDEADDEQIFVIYKVTFNPDGTITFTEVSDKIDKRFSRSADLMAFLEQNLNKPFLYSNDEPTVLRKAY